MHLCQLPEIRHLHDPEGAAIADDNGELTNAQFAESVRRAAAVLRAFGVSTGDVVAVKLPNTTGLVVTLFAAWRVGAVVTPINPSLVDAEVDYQVRDAGAKILVTDRSGESTVDVSDLTSHPLLDDVSAHACDDALALLIYTSGTTYFSAVPTIYTMLADLPADVRPDTSPVRFGICGAAPASVPLLERFENRYGFPLIEGYGLSEGTCASTVNPLDGRRKAGTVGLPLAGQTIRIADDTGAPVAGREAGEVLIKSPTVMRGYLNCPEETARTIVDGWLHTGDIGRLDADGYLVLVDRAKDMIIRGGENIYPKEIESVVYELAEVSAAAVVGRPSAVYGEEPVLFVALNSPGALTTEQILAHCRANLSKYKLPVEITIFDELPCNAVGKIDKPALRRPAPIAAEF